MSQKKYEVGYGKPPKQGQFKKGQSGNPKGRPKKKNPVEVEMRAPSYTRDHFAEMILEEANKTVTITEKGEPRTTTQKHAIFKAILAKGLNGNGSCLKMAMQLIINAQNEDRDQKRNLFEEIVKSKVQGEQILEECLSLGRKPPELIPHPDDIQLDVLNGSFRMLGPFSPEQKETYYSIALEYHQVYGALKGIDKDIKEESDANELGFLQNLKKEYLQRLNKLSVLISDRLKSKEWRETEGKEFHSMKMQRMKEGLRLKGISIPEHFLELYPDD